MPKIGRPKGSKNKTTQSTREMLDKLGCNPIMAMAMIAMDQSNPIEIRVTCLKEVAKYHSPQVRAMEVKDNQDSTINITWDEEDEDDDVLGPNNSGEETPE